MVVPLMCLHRPINRATPFYGQVIDEHPTEFSVGFTSISLGPVAGAGAVLSYSRGGMDDRPINTVLTLSLRRGYLKNSK
jgi:hypothetical protein